MQNKLSLSIAITSLAAIGAFSQPAHAADADGKAPAASAKPAASHGGKCASGKCGTEKIYSKAAIDKNPQGRLVHARDGKCGLTAEGHEVAQDSRRQLAEGVCGQ